MTLNFKKGDDGIRIPKKCISLLSDADICDLRVLLFAAELESFGEELGAERIAEALSVSVNEVTSSLKFWHGAGVVKKSAAKKKEVAEAEKPTEEQKLRRTLRDKQAMRITSAELCALAERNAEFKALLDAAQQTAGWIFNTTEIQIIGSLYSSLQLSGEYILALISYYVKRREKPLRYIETVAYGFVDDGITTHEALEEKLRYLEKYDGYEGKIRKLFGMGQRTLSAQEKKFIATWFDSYGYGIDLIKAAYEITVNNTGKAEIKYANKILENWHGIGVKTVADIDTKGTSKKGSASATTRAGTRAAQSFDVDEALAKALKRSYKQNNEG